MRHLFVASLTSLAVLGAHRAQAQTLDERERPLLNENHATVDIDYGQFAFESRVSRVGGSYTYFEPTHHSLVPRVGFGISKRAQLNVSGAYLPPIRRMRRPLFEATAEERADVDVGARLNRITA